MTDVVLAKLETRQSTRQPRRFALPFGILYIADALEKAGYRATVIHEEGTDKNIARLVNVVRKETPAWVGFSTITGPTILPSLKASRAIKRSSDVPIVWGGVHPTLLPEQTLLEDSIDIVAIGEGEHTAVEITAALADTPWTLARVKGIAFKDDGRALLTEPRPPMSDLDRFEPSWSHLDIERYVCSGEYFQHSRAGGDRVLAVITSRGCPSRCGYCYNQAVNKRTFRAHSVERVVRQIKHLKERYRITGIRFWDDNIFSDPARALRIFHEIDTPWICSIRANDAFRAGEELFRQLKQARCAELNIGVESGSQRMLHLMHKDITIDQVRWVARMCSKYEIHACFGFMVGLPGETWHDVCHTLQCMEDLQKGSRYCVVRGVGVFSPIPGTPLYDQAISLGFRAPKSLLDWSRYEVGHLSNRPPYMDRRIMPLSYCVRLAKRENLDRLPFPYVAKGFQLIAKLRLKHRFFHLPWDHALAEFLRAVAARTDARLLRLFYKN